MLELGFTQLGIVGGIIVAVGLYVMAEHNKFIGIWVLYAGLVIVGAGVVVHIHKVMVENERSHVPARADASTVARERAYVGLHDGTVSHPIGAPPTVSLVVRNSGNTTALNVTWTARFILAIPEAPDTEFTFDKRDTSPISLGKDATLSYEYTFENWKPEFDALIEKRQAVFFAFGEIRYKDVFGNDYFNDYRLISGGRFDIGKGIGRNKWGVADRGNAQN